MKILLIQPKDIIGNYRPKRPLLAQAYLGASLEKNGHNVKILDMRIKKVEEEFGLIAKRPSFCLGYELKKGPPKVAILTPKASPR